MDTETFCSGEVLVEMTPDPSRPAGRRRVQARVALPDGRDWVLTDLTESSIWAKYGLVELAETALIFCSYYSTNNRHDDLPDWAPDAEFADEVGRRAFRSPSTYGSAIPHDFPKTGNVATDGTVFRGHLYCVFDGAASQARWSKLLDES